MYEAQLTQKLIGFFREHERNLRGLFRPHANLECADL